MNKIIKAIKTKLWFLNVNTNKYATIKVSKNKPVKITKKRKY